MKRLSLSAMFVLGIAVYANAQGLGPSMNQGLNYDGIYAGVSVVNNSQGNTWTSGGSQPCVQEPAPTLSIARGRAEFPWQGCMLGGNVSPSGNDDDLQALARCSRDRSIASIKSLAR